MGAARNIHDSMTRFSNPRSRSAWSIAMPFRPGSNCSCRWCRTAHTRRIDHLQNVVEVVFQIAVTNGERERSTPWACNRASCSSPIVQKRYVWRSGVRSGYVPARRQKYLLFQRRNLPFAGTNLRDNPAFSSVPSIPCSISSIISCAVPARCGSPHVPGKTRPGNNGAGHHVDPRRVHYIEHKLRMRPM